jgi:hypothetical protein
VPHVQLADRGAALRPVRQAVDHEAAAAADALAAVVLEGHRLFALVDQVFVQHVEHLEERHVLVTLGISYFTIRPGSFGPFWRQMFSVSFMFRCSLLLVAALGQVHVLEIERLHQAHRRLSLP